MQLLANTTSPYVRLARMAMKAFACWAGQEALSIRNSSTCERPTPPFNACSGITGVGADNALS